MRVKVKGDLLRWARERAGRTHDELHKRFPRLDRWEGDEAQPTLKQLEDFAKTPTKKLPAHVKAKKPSGGAFAKYRGTY